MANNTTEKLEKIMQDQAGQINGSKVSKYDNVHFDETLGREVGYAIAVDLDGTLAEYWGWQGEEHIGAAIVPVLERVKQEIRNGAEVWIFSARCTDQRNTEIILKWCDVHGLAIAGVTNIKYKFFQEFWDDRAKQVVPNTGVFVEQQRDTLDYNYNAMLPKLKEYEAQKFLPDENGESQGEHCLRPANAFEDQVGGNHYKKYKIQPFTFCRVNNIPAAESEIITHVMRHKDKMGREDLEKAKHLIDLILESDY